MGHAGQLAQLRRQRLERFLLYVHHESIRQRIAAERRDDFGHARHRAQLLQRFLARHEADRGDPPVRSQGTAERLGLRQLRFGAQEHRQLRLEAQPRAQAAQPLEQRVAAGRKRERHADDQRAEQARGSREARQRRAERLAVLIQPADHRMRPPSR